MSPRVRSNPRAVLSGFGDEPSSEQILAFAQAVAECAAPARYPAKSAASQLRQLADALARFDARVVERLRAAVVVEVDQLRGASGVPPAVDVGADDAAFERMLTVDGYAARVGVSEVTIRERLKTPDGRERMGWPQWDGHRWLIPPQVTDHRSAAFRATLPRLEPQPHLLPPWCSRQQFPDTPDGV